MIYTAFYRNIQYGVCQLQEHCNNIKVAILRSIISNFTALKLKKPQIVSPLTFGWQKQDIMYSTDDTMRV